MDRLDKFLLGASSALLLAGALAVTVGSRGGYDEWELAGGAFAVLGAVPYAGGMIRHWND